VQNPNMQKEKIEKPQMQKLYPNMQKFMLWLIVAKLIGPKVP